MHIEYKVADLSDLDEIVLVGDELFDLPVKEANAREFLQDSRHHMILAYDSQSFKGNIQKIIW